MGLKDELDKMTNEAEMCGRRAGYEAGYKQGRTDGYESGRRVRSAEMVARDDGYTRGRDEAFVSAGLMAQAALKTGGFAKFENEAKELADALDGFLERERSSGDISRRIWDSAAALTKAYTAGDTVGIGGSGQAHLFTLLRRLRKDSYIDGFEKARIRVSNLLSDAKPPERHEIKDPVSDVLF